MLEIRIANPPTTLLGAYSNDSKKFYTECVKFTNQILGSDDIQDCIKELCEKESIEIRPIDVRIMVFPSQGNATCSSKLQGLCDLEKNQVSIYPPFDYDQTPEWLVITNQHVRDQITMTSITTLIHELLHKKYNNEFMAEKGLEINELESIVKEKSLIYAAKLLVKLGIINVD